MPVSACQTDLQQPISEHLLSLLEAAVSLEKWPIAKLISLFEANTEQGFIQRHQLMAYIQQQPKLASRRAYIVGVTGAPGVGKSSLIGELCLQLLKQQPGAAIAVLAIDPSSHNSGGALLGDRTRSLFPVGEKRLFFRSQSSALDLGGLSRKTFQVTRILQYLFDYIVIETVGVGQSEVEVAKLCDHSFFVMQPLAGDQLQFIKSGIMEMPDSFIINKCDEQQYAEQSLQQLEASLRTTRSLLKEGEESVIPPVFLSSSVTKQGFKDLADYITGLSVNEGNRNNTSNKENYFIAKWVRYLYGEYGYNIYINNVANKVDGSMSYEQKQLLFKQSIDNKNSLISVPNQ
ncbi:hypothetical protein NO559_12130 [Dasania sp. GY-MA-18]|uniref:Protein kinase n=1 Tax=Dasania phycosphaerae TaxID=2950436 RepID=A0A9J6RPK3_9GAMM|nr:MULTISPECIES: GTP-binding protein [Dasania]MCR8923523.1 hypothetical protein [Dasania sp. GY-MA-18]MCZ0865957.1 hypothetical protein [Dasania phycosphaerae]MCZ0869681.1 hypothetical protein [Dasania phycosphaerae]